MEELKSKYGSGVATLLRVRGLNPEGLVEQILQDATARAGSQAGERSFCEEVIRLIGKIEPSPAPLEEAERSQLAVQVEEVLSGMPVYIQEEIVRYAIGGIETQMLSEEACDALCQRMERADVGKRRPPAALVVDDDSVNRRFVATVLKAIGWRVELAFDGAEAASLAEQNQFDLILMDYQLPGANGAEVAKAIRAGIGPSSGAYILGASVADVRRECLEAGMDEYFQKPIDVNTLKNRAQTVAAASAQWHASERGAAGPDSKLRGLEEYRERLQRIVAVLGA